MYVFKTLKPFFLQHKWTYILGILSLLVVDILQLLIPEVLRSVTDSLQRNSLSFHDLFIYGLYILLIGLSLAVFRFFWRMLILGASRKLEYYLRNKLFSHLLTMSADYYNRHKTGDLMAHVTNDIHAVRMACGPGIVAMTDAIFLNIAVITMMSLTTDLRLTALALLPMPLLIYSMTKFGKRIHTSFKEVQEGFSAVTDKVQENISGIRVVKSFVQEEAEMEAFEEKNQLLFHKNMKLAKISGTFHPLVQFLSSLSFVITIGYGGALVIYGVISLGDFVAFTTYLALLVSSVSVIGRVINSMQRGMASMARINSILEEEAEIKDTSHTKDLLSIGGDIAFHHVSFKYPQSKAYALKNVSVQLVKGQSLGILGRTGSGKTTIPHLLLRLYTNTEGAISIDNQPIEAIPLKLLRESIGFVDQDSILFSTTIQNNIGFGVDNYSIEEVERFSKIAAIHDNIIDFPNSYETTVGERGITLSGGQKQRISIARALIKNPKILILDDCLSAVDTDTEEKILSSLKEIMANKTTIIIAHRVSTIKHCDKIIVLEEGMIAEEGSHQELLKHKGIYATTCEKQQLEEKIYH